MKPRSLGKVNTFCKDLSENEIRVLCMCVLSCVWLSDYLARILHWVVFSFSRGSSPPKDRNCASCGFCIGRQILYHWAIWEVLLSFLEIGKKKNHIKTTPLKLLFSIFSVMAELCSNSHSSLKRFCALTIFWLFIYMISYNMRSFITGFFLV